MSRLESGNISINPDWCDIHDLFDRVTKNLADELKTFRTDIVIPEPMPLVKIDSGLIEPVLYNLVHNSCRYAPAGTTIRLKAFYDNNNLVIQEMDRGPGFDPDILPHAFNKYHRSKDIKTVGLGLSIAKGFVDAHKGSISVENRQNGGARFTILIPTEIIYERP
jgi:two-component system sensor histidine kinase KdpD